MTDEDIRQLIQKHGLFHGTIALGIVMDASHLRQFASLIEENAAASEREACAKSVEADCCETSCWASNSIRARGEK